MIWGPRGEAVMHLLADKDLADPLQKDVVAIADGNVAGSGFSVLLRDGRIITWSTPDSDSGVRTELVNKSYSVFYGDEVKFTSLVGGFGGITEAGELIQWSPYTTSEDIFVEPATEYLSNGWATQSRSDYVREASSPAFEPVVELVHNRVLSGLMAASSPGVTPPMEAMTHSPRRNMICWPLISE